jgi:putative transposase
MSTETDLVPDSGDVAESSSEQVGGVPRALPDDLAEELVAAARSQGIARTGPGGLLSGLTEQVLETALETELTEHLGHERGGVPGPGGNMRNGHSAKTVRTEIGDVRTEIGDVRIKVPRDRTGSFEPVAVPQHARRLTGFDEAVISLRESPGRHLRLSGVAGPGLQGHRRRRGRHAAVGEPAAGPDLRGAADRCDLREDPRGTSPTGPSTSRWGSPSTATATSWVCGPDPPAAARGARMWLGMLTDLKNRGVKDVLIACCDC